MHRFAFMLHPMSAGDVAMKFKFAKFIPDSIIERAFALLPPIKASQITGIRSRYGEAEGWFIACPLTASLIMSMPQAYVMNKIIQGGRMAEKLGAKILGLGAFTKIVGDAGVTVARSLKIPVTTGNSYTVATAVESVREAAKAMGHDLKKAAVVILGATGSIGRVCALILAREVRSMTLVAREERKLEELAAKVLYDTGLAVKVTSDNKKALRTGDIVITVTSALDTVIEPEDLRPGAVVCDVARPRDVSRRVAEVRDDVLVIEGGVVEVPGEVEFNLNFGFPPGTAYACMAETMVLALEKRYESFTLGRDLCVEKVEEIAALAKKHGFKLAGFRSFGRAIPPQEIEMIKSRARSGATAK
ncbi:saccharopine dehydrogenase NADP-binding domain-containing protein [Pelotomaculum terephthalicicum JT]|uniref:saccharopine dehydrogenase NADP-binding domain-containing protein n=1 Tax=Pelotomaculum TaxID=191373 RepID=UPI0009CFB075|nr:MULTISPECIES: saccharopine dehydrogenase NADP-binding domain-containing protein [Pelotomaculum]MCG9968276.1 saccharopine dehydrogenase NADP-binding domain-containing protein [Pelotomaculum terephthalicicum JT]OPX89519.1 MAG: Long-chain acyl-(acyl-carrier-protein) reductase [Pelotomaculum sp. PtaB.Bin117]OPY63276.1 MAG: Long-chain acyl-(acyl-carrier-protein) reductase [Pelotomaculum sp. PtaU1.Bin065]